MTVRITENRLIDGDPLNPESTDLIAQRGTLLVGEPVPDGWRVLSGNSIASEVWRVVFRFEVDQ